MPTPDEFARRAFGDDDPDAIDRLVDAIEELGPDGLHAVSVPRALVMARECRAALDLTRTGRVADVHTRSPHRPLDLYDAALADAHGDEAAARELYTHALTEAGMIVDHDNRPLRPCPHCGWEAP
jgi:trans-aconitate methyltransferase